MNSALTVVTGETGTGKTRFCRRLLRGLKESSYIDASVLKTANLLQRVGVSRDNILVIDNCSSQTINLVSRQHQVKQASHIFLILEDSGFDLPIDGHARIVHLRPLRHQPCKLRRLITIISTQKARQIGRPAPEISPCFIEAAAGWNWPGNIRELDSLLTQLSYMNNEHLWNRKTFNTGMRRKGIPHYSSAP